MKELCHGPIRCVILFVCDNHHDCILDYLFWGLGFGVWGLGFGGQLITNTVPRGDMLQDIVKILSL